MNSLKSVLLIAILLGPLWLWPAPAQALVPMEGQFVAKQTCEAVQSIKKRTNPGNIRLQSGMSYTVLGKNRDNASHYLLHIAAAKPSERWVPVSCGQLGADASSVIGQTSVQTSGQTSKNADFLLALSWQPSFCETKPNKPECQSQTGDRFDASHLVLHGLWPQPETNTYCGVSQKLIQLDKASRWSELPELDLSRQTRTALAERMPGVASNLHRHEWYKHGTCYSNTPEEYFQEAIALLDQINRSEVQQLLTNNINFLLTNTEIRSQFDQAFGVGSGEKVEVKCAQDIDEDKEIMVVELWLNLRGKIEPNTPIQTLLRAAPRAAQGCRQGEIDPAGFGNG